jgi:hypothetical protein
MPELLPLLLPEVPTNVHDAEPRALGPVVHKEITGVSKLLLETVRKFAVGVLQTAAEFVLESDPNTAETE